MRPWKFGTFLTTEVAKLYNKTVERQTIYLMEEFTHEEEFLQW